MERNNIFKLLEQNYKSFESNLFRIDELFQKRYMIEQNFGQKTTLKNFVQQHCFYSWKNRGRCIDVDDENLNLILFLSAKSQNNLHYP